MGTSEKLDRIYYARRLWYCWHRVRNGWKHGLQWKKLIAITVDSSRYSYQEVESLWIAFGQTYFEFNVDGGWTLLGLVRQSVPTCESDGIKIWTDGDYVLLCGLGARGSLRDITDEVLTSRAYQQTFSKVGTGIVTKAPETPREVARIRQMLSFIDADCSYDVYLRIVWAILSLGWTCAEQLAHDWSMTASVRFDPYTFRRLVQSYNSAHPESPTAGTLYHHARLGGWNG